MIKTAGDLWAGAFLRGIKWGLSPFLPLILLMLPAVPVYAADGDTPQGLHPYISVQEEYNDNINLTNTNRKEDYLTTVKPGLKYTRFDETYAVNLDYSPGLVSYARNSNLNYVSQNGTLDVKYLTKEHVNFYLKDSLITSDNPREQEYFTTTADNKYVLATQTVRSVYTRNVVAPTVEYQFGPESRVGFNYRNNIYRTASTSDQNSMEDYFNPFVSYSFDRKNNIYVEYGYTIGNFEKTPNMTGNFAHVRYAYSYSENSSVFGEYSYTKREFASQSASYINYDIHEPYVGITHAFSPTLKASAQVGYFWQEPVSGPKNEGPSYKASLVNLDVRTTYTISLQGGYTEDYFTAENLGFVKYNRLTGSIQHFLEKRTSVSLAADVEYEQFVTNRNDWVWGVTGSVSHTFLKWLTASLELSHRESNSSVDVNDYSENWVMVKLTATY
jgi:hypothetical protein